MEEENNLCAETYLHLLDSDVMANHGAYLYNNEVNDSELFGDHIPFPSQLDFFPQHTPNPVIHPSPSIQIKHEPIHHIHQNAIPMNQPIMHPISVPSPMNPTPINVINNHNQSPMVVSNANHPVVPSKLEHSLSILGVPEKSRVETQIKLCLRFQKSPNSPQDWKILKLQPHLLAPIELRRKLNAQKQNKQSELVRTSEVKPCLILEANVIAASSNVPVHRCYGCIQREYRDLERKVKRRKISNEAPQQVSTEEEKLKILQFHCEPVLDFSTGEVIIPVRITCYCRHHKEPEGFIIQITLYDSVTKSMVTSSSSSVVMITDDHKVTKKRTRQQAESSSSSSSVKLDPDSSVVSSTEYHTSSPTNNSPSPPRISPPPPVQNFQQQSQSPPQQPLLPQQQHSPNTQSSSSRAESPTHVDVNQPTIQRVIPSEGPISGGIEITVLGTSFYPGLRCLFGMNESSQTQLWGDSTLVAVLPPAMAPGPVLVALRDPRDTNIIPNPVNLFFLYKDNADRQLLELALQVIGMRLNGRIENPTQIALQIVNNNQDQYRQGFTTNVQTNKFALSPVDDHDHDHDAHEEQPFVTSQSPTPSSTPPSGFPTAELLSLTLKSSSSSSPGDINNGDEKDLDVTIIERALQYVIDVDSEHDLDLSLQNDTGHHLLHLAVIKNYASLVSFLLKNMNKSDLNVQDNCGWTALHFASFHGNKKLVKKLLKRGASPLINNENGDTPFDLTQSQSIKNLLKSYEIGSNEDDDVDVVVIGTTIHSSKSSSNLDATGVILEDDEEIEMKGEEEESEVIFLDTPAKDVTAPMDDVINIGSFSISGKMANRLLMFHQFILHLLFTFWSQYRIYLYLGLLAATGVWTLIEYIPAVSGSTPAPAPVEIYQSKYSTLCNPPSLKCGSPVTSEDAYPVLTTRSFLKSAPSLESLLLSFGQFFLFLTTLCLIVYHFRPRLRLWEFWALIIIIIAILVIGALFVFDVL
eukprot:TRINITY_DN566_c1_g1_i2.p1 TRINITY_DN566_c1_g1~~TRINITY_DN566_c1_g1_i2.p1  ORF type:complete len:978 (-),score=298.74 TRINITY_DN566_c1_g1_i2:128-3061(-)